ncbi:hypothetical protein ACJMK2_038966 [Sinanodonta woodiana]|uniref:Sushi, von Willebrand factor type A, EGF and pentraxin domain-containing protein 1-like n=1 Tax=Sinanodonta woodiana TaxID=1069815 RepID=A0ABD3WDS3_SINWO
MASGREMYGATAKKPKRRTKRGWFFWSPPPPPPPPPPPLDTTPPTLTCPPNIAVTVSQLLQTSTSVTWTEPIASDNIDGVIYPSRNGAGPGSTFNEGLSSVVYTAIDSTGNSATCSLSISVTVVRCSTPLYSSPGTFSCSPSDLIAGSSCYFYCTKAGYELVGSSVTSCIISGTWYNDIPKCQRVTCGDPGTIDHGSTVSNGFYYGNTVRYTCDIYYNLTGVSVRTCQENKTWSGLEPKCQYVNSCESRPCQNGATCINKLDDYTCVCGPGWSGKNCSLDIQPAVFQDCPASIIKHTSTPTANVIWTAPLYSDPLGRNLTLFSNYPRNNWEFPWGDFTVQYNVLKTSNGLWTNCTFPLKVRPFECIPLGVPQNGITLCNGWKTDYFRICLGICLQGFGFLPMETGTQWFMCTASGYWIPVNQGNLPSCYAPYANNTLTFKGISVPVVADCSTPNARTSLGRFYVDSLMADGNVKDMCTDYKDECIPENVEIRCQP